MRRTTVLPVVLLLTLSGCAIDQYQILTTLKQAPLNVATESVPVATSSAPTVTPSAGISYDTRLQALLLGQSLADLIKRQGQTTYNQLAAPLEKKLSDAYQRDSGPFISSAAQQQAQADLAMVRTEVASGLDSAEMTARDAGADTAKTTLLQGVGTSTLDDIGFRQFIGQKVDDAKLSVHFDPVPLSLS